MYVSDWDRRVLTAVVALKVSWSLGCPERSFGWYFVVDYSHSAYPDTASGSLSSTNVAVASEWQTVVRAVYPVYAALIYVTPSVTEFAT